MTRRAPVEILGRPRELSVVTSPEAGGVENVKRRAIHSASLMTLIVAISACSAAPGGAGSGDAPAETAGGAAPQAWRANASEHRGQDGERFEYSCPPGGGAATVWGTDVYTDDSSVCTAAVHAGKITFAQGGTVTIEMGPGEESYESSERNGVTTSDYGQWGGSFIFPEDD